MTCIRVAYVWVWRARTHACCSSTEFMAPSLSGCRLWMPFISWGGPHLIFMRGHSGTTTGSGLAIGTTLLGNQAGICRWDYY